MTTVKKQSVLKDERTGLPMRVVHLAVLDDRDPEVRSRIAEQVAALHPDDEQDALRWMEGIYDSNDREWTPQE
ncbi:MAG: hypothetical protein ACK4N1_04295 [Pseudorhizobium sp.]